MKRRFTYLLIACAGCLLFSTSSCKKDKTDSGLPPNSTDPSITVVGSNTTVDYGIVFVGQSSTKNLQATGANLKGVMSVTASGGYSVSIDNNNFSSSLNLDSASVANGKVIYVKFTPTELGTKTGTVVFESNSVSAVTVNLTGTGNILHNYTSFANENLAFGGGQSQSATHQYTFLPDVTNVSKITMYVKLRCPSGNCGDWDVYAHIQVKDPTSGDWYEMGRYITPYGVDNSATGRGFEFDVTDFKSLLQGTVDLRAFIEVWTADGWLLSVDFDFLEGAPDYKYSAISKVLQYNDNSLGGVIYGEDATAFDLTKTITVPSNAEATFLRTIITGWGEATPYDPDGRPCAEWCFRTHHIKINGTNTFTHQMNPLGCGSNPVHPQGGNWSPDRAGWCPGMAVPVRENQMATSMAGQTFSFEYSFEPWVNNLASPNPNPHAYNAISTYVVVKSNSPISKATVN